MSEDSLSLRTFILGDPPNAALSQCVASVTAALGTSLFDVRHFDWSSLAGEISEKLEQMFDIRLTDILAAAWKDYQALLDCADPSKHTAEETISLPVVDHRIETTLKPCLEIVVGERQPIRLTFEIACERLAGVVHRRGLPGKPYRSASFGNHGFRIAPLLRTFSLEVILCLSHRRKGKEPCQRSDAD